MADAVSTNGFRRNLGSTTSQLKIVSGAGSGVVAQDRVFIGSAQLVQEGADPSALLLGYGNSTTRVQSATASAKFISFYTEDTGGGGQYGVYFRHYVSSAGLSDDCLRVFATVNNVAAATVRGAHISLSQGTTGSVSGLGCALEATVHINTAGSAAGTLYGVKSAMNSDGAASDPAGATTVAYFGAVNQGDATGMADVDTDAVLFDVVGHSVGTGTLFQAVTTGYILSEITHSLKCKADGTTIHLLASTLGAQAT
jgi:hypothetical protein